MLLSLKLNPHEVDARNTLGLIYAEEGRYTLAREEWSDLLSADPAYTPARDNLTILNASSASAQIATRTAWRTSRVSAEAARQDTGTTGEVGEVVDEMLRAMVEAAFGGCTDLAWRRFCRLLS